MKSSAQARHGSMPVLENVTTRSVGAMPPVPRRNEIGAIKRTRVVGSPSIVNRKLLGRNGFGVLGNCMGALSPARTVDLAIDASRMNISGVLPAPSKPGTTKSAIAALVKSRYDMARF